MTGPIETLGHRRLIITAAVNRIEIEIIMVRRGAPRHLASLVLSPDRARRLREALDEALSMAERERQHP